MISTSSLSEDSSIISSWTSDLEISFFISLSFSYFIILYLTASFILLFYCTGIFPLGIFIYYLLLLLAIGLLGLYCLILLFFTIYGFYSLITGFGLGAFTLLPPITIADEIYVFFNVSLTVYYAFFPFLRFLCRFHICSAVSTSY